MKTIEERAKAYAKKEGSISLSEVYNQCLAEIYEKAYIAGANQQRKIDIEKSLRWIIDTIVPIFGDFLNAYAIQDELTKHLMSE